MDMPTAEDECHTPPGQPDLMWTPVITRDVQDWQKHGLFPFPDWPIGLRLPDPTQYSLQSLRLIHHLAATYTQLRVLGANSLTLWTRHIPAYAPNPLQNRTLRESGLLTIHQAH